MLSKLSPGPIPSFLIFTQKSGRQHKLCTKSQDHGRPLSSTSYFRIRTNSLERELGFEAKELNVAGEQSGMQDLSTLKPVSD